MDSSRRRDAGGSKVGLIVVLAVLVLAGMIAWKFINAKTTVYEFDKKTEDIVRLASMRNSDQELKDAIMTAAKKVFGAQVPFTIDAIDITRPENKVFVQIQYIYNVKTPLFTHKMNVKVEKRAVQF